MEIKRTICQICKCDCGVIAEVEDNRIIKVRGDPENPNNRGKLCIKGLNSYRTVYHPDRIRKPLLNTGERGDPRWKEISWKKALDLMTEKLKEIKEDGMEESLVFLHGPTGRILDRSMVKRFAYAFGTPNITGSWSYCVGPKVLASQLIFGFPFPTGDFPNSRLIVLWGTNPVISKFHRYHGIVEDIITAKKNGAKIIVIDPRKSETAKLSDVHLKIKPGSDIYLALGLINRILDKKLYDSEFIKRYVSGFEKLEKYVSEFTPEYVESFTDIPAESVENVGELIGKIKPAVIDRREGVLHNINGFQTARAIAILSAITGNVDVVGGTIFNPSLRINDITLKELLPDNKKPFWHERHPLASDCSGILSDVILSGKPYDIRVLVIFKSNPLLTLPNTGKLIKAFRKLDLIVTHDIFLTETCRYSDIVLPSSTFFEKAEIDAVPLKKLRWIRIRRRVIEPVGEARSEAEFMIELARAMGYEKLFPFEDEDEILRELLRGTEVEGYSLEDLERGILLEYEVGRYRKDGFPTSSGKIELFPKILEEMGMKGLNPIIHSESDSRYPYLLITGARNMPYYHSQFRNVENLRKMVPEPLAEIGRMVAEERGIIDGDHIIIRTSTGEIKIKARVSPDIHEYTVSIPHGWVECNANLLVDDSAVEPLTGAPMFRGLRCDVQKAR